eukprot:NODE_9359_length_344_cov_130.169550.p2 GENE.NODE_9359_length_344_cov_130.169550~~NODE_9359_length_344_cov_130.169550.p2  ORF type:complete len:73 (+),score=10.39 NODE_9359_length_344_cov_130.169550:3-221(+)
MGGRGVAEPAEPAPVTPDPSDRTVSKRSWKHGVQDWRMALIRQYVAAGHGGGSLDPFEFFALPPGAEVDEAD